MPGPPAMDAAAATTAATAAGVRGVAEHAGCMGRLCGAQAVEVRTARRKTTSVRLVRSQSQKTVRVAPGARTSACQSRRSGGIP